MGTFLTVVGTVVAVALVLGAVFLVLLANSMGR